MDTTRRSVLVQGAVIGAGVISSEVSGISALGQTKTPLRRTLQGLAWNDPIVETYRDGVGIMKNLAASKKFNWVAMSEIHGDLQNGYHFCPHGDWYFLPWHRAFVVMYERVIRHLTNNADFAMPFWDWTANAHMPEIFLSRTTPDGKKNWLFVDEEGQRRTWPAARPMPASIVGPTVLARILKDSPFEIFGTSRPDGQDNLDPSWVVGGGGVEGTLEARPHNQVHNNIGGWMPTPASPRDPIFFMHHSNIDRIWAMWNVHHSNSKDPLWTNMAFTKNFLNVDGTPWSPKVSDLYVPEELGYTYGLHAVVASAVTAGPRTMALDEKLRSVIPGGAANLGPTAGVTTVTVENQKTATPAEPLSLSLQLPRNALEAVAHRPALPSGVDALNFSNALETAASGPRVLAFLRQVEITDPSTTAVRVFLNAEQLSADTPDDDPHFVGSFAVLEHGAAHHALPSFVLDLSETIQRLYGSGEHEVQEIRLQLVPVGAGEGGKPGTVTPKRLEVSVVTP